MMSRQDTVSCLYFTCVPDRLSGGRVTHRSEPCAVQECPSPNGRGNCWAQHLDASEQRIEQDRLLTIALKHQASSIHGPIEG